MGHVRIFFKYNTGVVDDCETESLWALPQEKGYQIDNIPFYVREIADGDVVTAQRGPDGELWYDSLVRSSGHSTVRLWFARTEDVQKVREELRGLGCASELSDLPRLVAVDVPPNVPYSLVRAKLDHWEREGLFEFEEACLGQSP